MGVKKNRKRGRAENPQADAKKAKGKARLKYLSESSGGDTQEACIHTHKHECRLPHALLGEFSKPHTPMK